MSSLLLLDACSSNSACCLPPFLLTIISVKFESVRAPSCGKEVCNVSSTFLVVLIPGSMAIFSSSGRRLIENS